ncbi:MAG TPA: hypothetical protein VF881_02080 [Polyangiaceae bacterium]
MLDRKAMVCLALAFSSSFAGGCRSPDWSGTYTATISRTNRCPQAVPPLPASPNVVITNTMVTITLVGSSSSCVFVRRGSDYNLDVLDPVDAVCAAMIAPPGFTYWDATLSLPELYLSWVSGTTTVDGGSSLTAGGLRCNVEDLFLLTRM